MNSIADSSSYSNDDRMLPQHQAVVTVLQRQLSEPGIDSFGWLDLACGQGQIVAHLEKNLAESCRRVVRYVACDVNNEYVRIAEKRCARLNMKKTEFHVCDVANFAGVIQATDAFDLVTVVNTWHELAPRVLPDLLIDVLKHLKNEGTLFIYDMDKIEPRELGAIEWSAVEINEILESLIAALGLKTHPLLAVGTWPHTNCRGWNIQIIPRQLGLTAGVDYEHARLKLRDSVRSIVARKYDRCRQLLESLTKYGPSDESERTEIMRNLHQFWALSRAQSE